MNLFSYFSKTRNPVALYTICYYGFEPVTFPFNSSNRKVI